MNSKKQLLAMIASLILFPVLVGIFSYLLWGSLVFGIVAGIATFLVFPVELALIAISVVSQTGNSEMTWTQEIYKKIVYFSLPVGTLFVFWGAVFQVPTVTALFVFLLIEYAVFFFGIRGQRITSEDLLSWYKDMLPVVAVLWVIWAIFAPSAYKALAAPLLLLNVAEAMHFGYIRFK